MQLHPKNRRLSQATLLVVLAALDGCRSASNEDATPPPAEDGGAETAVDDAPRDPPGGAFTASFFSGRCTSIDADRTIVGLDPPKSIGKGAVHEDDLAGIDDTSAPSLFLATIDGKKTPIALGADLATPSLPLVEWSLPSPKIRAGRVLGLARPMYPALPGDCDLHEPGCSAPPPRANAAFVFAGGAWSSTAIPGDVILAYVSGANGSGTMVGAFRLDDAAAADESPSMVAFEGGAHDVAFVIAAGKVTTLPGMAAVALDVDGKGNVVGKDAQAEYDRAVLWRGGDPIVLDHEARNSLAIAMNDAGTIVGAVAGPDGAPRAATFTEAGAKLLRPLGDGRSVAHAVSSGGSIFGYAAVAGASHAFVNEGGATVDLNPSDAAGNAFLSSSVADVTPDGRVAVGDGIDANGTTTCIVWVRK